VNDASREVSREMNAMQQEGMGIQSEVTNMQKDIRGVYFMLMLALRHTKCCCCLFFYSVLPVYIVTSACFKISITGH
jgi:hypothetical protein